VGLDGEANLGVARGALNALSIANHNREWGGGDGA